MNNQDLVVGAHNATDFVKCFFPDILPLGFTLEHWFVCPVKPSFAQTKSAFLDRTPGFLVRSTIPHVVLDLAKEAEPDYEFTGEVIPYTEYVPGLSKAGQLADLRRWIGYMNRADDMPIGTVIMMD